MKNIFIAVIPYQKEKNMAIQIAQSIDVLLEAAEHSGRFGRFVLDNASYYPSARVQEQISQNLFGISSKEGLMYSERAREMRKRSGFSPIMLIDRPLAHTPVEGEFLLLYRDGLYLGILDIGRVMHKEFPEVNLSVISSRALSPHYHQVTDFSVEGRAHIYTVDEDGSNWSLRCKFKK